jgi:hypothetical protein
LSSYILGRKGNIMIENKNKKEKRVVNLNKKVFGEIKRFCDDKCYDMVKWIEKTCLTAIIDDEMEQDLKDPDQTSHFENIKETNNKIRECYKQNRAALVDEIYDLCKD